MNFNSDMTTIMDDNAPMQCKKVADSHLQFILYSDQNVQIINASFFEQTDVFSQPWKTVVTPLIKKKKNKLNNYSPISNLPFIK